MQGLIFFISRGYFKPKKGIFYSTPILDTGDFQVPPKLRTHLSRPSIAIQHHGRINPLYSKERLLFECNGDLRDVRACSNPLGLPLHRRIFSIAAWWLTNTHTATIANSDQPWRPPEFSSDTASTPSTAPLQHIIPFAITLRSIASLLIVNSARQPPYKPSHITPTSGVSIDLRFTSVRHFPAKSTLATAPTPSPLDGELIKGVTTTKRREVSGF